MALAVAVAKTCFLSAYRLLAGVMRWRLKIAQQQAWRTFFFFFCAHNSKIEIGVISAW